MVQVYDSVVDKAGSNTVLDKVKPLGNKAHQCCAIVLDAVTRVPNQSDKLKSLIRILTSGSFQVCCVLCVHCAMFMSVLVCAVCVSAVV